MTRGYSLWLRGIQLIGMHYRVYRALHETLRERRLGVTAPRMTLEAAERWRASYRRYRARKHADKRKQVILSSRITQHLVVAGFRIL